MQLMLPSLMVSPVTGRTYQGLYLIFRGLLRPLEKAIHQHFIPALTGQEICSKSERDLLALPVRLGGMGLTDPLI